MSNILRSKIAIAVIALVGIAVIAAVVGVTAVSVANAQSYTFSVNLKSGSTGTDVMNLQKVLNMSADTQVSTSGAGSPGSESTYFGSKTKAAVVKFQNKYKADVLTPVGLSSGTGFVGAQTRAKLNALYGGVVVTPPGSTIPITGGALSVASGSQPANGLAVMGVTANSTTGASRVPFTKIMLTAGSADVTVNGVVVERTGAAVDAVFNGVVLLDENGVQIGISKTLNSNHQATIGDNFVIRAGTSRTLTVAGNMGTSNTSYAGQVVGLNVVSVNTNGTVSGSLPIMGGLHTINQTLALGTATGVTSSYNPTAQSKDIGTTNYKFSAIKIEAGSAEAIRLRDVRFYQAGSAAAGDIANVKISVDGTTYDTTVSADGKYYSANFGTGIVVDKGLSKDIWIAGDIVGAGSSGRTIDFDVQKNTDVYLTGEVYGYGILAGGTITTASPSFNGVVTQISAGTVSSISKSNTVAAQNIAINVSGQPLGGYETDMKGEAVSVNNQVFYFGGTIGGTNLLTNVTLYGPNGNVVAGPVDAQANGAGQKVTFSDTVTYPVGKAVYTLKGKVSSATTNGKTVTASTTPSSDWQNPTGQLTGTTITLPATLVTMNEMTVKSGAMAMSVSSQPTARSVIAGAKGFEFARYNLDAGQSGEDVRLTSFKALLALTTITASQLSNCNLYDGSLNVTGDSSVTVATGDNNFTFNGGGLTVLKGTQKTLSMMCDLSSGATTGDVKWGLTDNSSTYTGATGVQSSQTVVETMTAAAGQLMTATTGGSYTVTQDSSLLYGTAQAGVTGVTLAKLRFTAGASENVTLKQIALELGNTASNSPADLVGERVTIWNGTTQIGTAQLSNVLANNNATSSILSPAPVVNAGESIVLTIKGDLSAQNINEGTPGAFLSVTYDGDNNGINGNYGTGVSSQTNINGGTATDVTSAGIRIFRTVPTFAVTSTGGTLSPGGELYKVLVSNGNSRDVVLKKLSFSIATTGGAVTGYTLYGDGVAANGSVVEAPLGVLEVTFDATTQAKLVPANSSKTYILKAATVVDTASVAESVTIALLADTAFPDLAGATLMGTVSDVENGSGNKDNIIWSPFSTTTPEATSATETNLDWVNGYGLPGFPSNAAFPTQTWTRPN